jgi:hypothetical protein
MAIAGTLCNLTGGVNFADGRWGDDFVQLWCGVKGEHYQIAAADANKQSDIAV